MQRTITMKSLQPPLDENEIQKNIESMNEYLYFKKLERKIKKKERDYKKKYDNILYKGYTKEESDFINEVKKQMRMERFKKNTKEIGHTYIFSTTTIEEEQGINGNETNQCITF